MSLGIITDFLPEDGRAWDSWDFSSPLFENFFILGPKNFHDDVSPVCLYEYPDVGAADELRLERFCFMDGLHFKNIIMHNSNSVSGMFSTTPEAMEEYIFIKSEAGNPMFHYCIRFRACPLDRPALEDPGDEMVQDIQFFRTVKVFPSCFFAYCLVSRHPFHALLFQILRVILKCEARVRMSSPNLHGLASLQQYVPEAGMQEYMWPQNVVQLRKKILDAFYYCHLPAFGKCMAIDIRDDSVPFVWRMPVAGEIPVQMALWAYEPLMEWISVDNFVQIITSIVLERSILVTGSNVQKVIKTVVLLPQLIVPLFWLCPIVTLLPEDMLGLLDAPMPTIFGLYRKLKRYVTDDRVIIDLDTKQVELGENLGRIQLPKRDKLISELRPIWGVKIAQNAMTSVLNIVRSHLEAVIVEQMQKSTMTKMDANREETGFAEQVFKLRYPKESQPFVAEFMKTQMFQGYKEQLCLNRTQSRRRDSGIVHEGSSSMSLASWCLDVNARAQPDK